VVELVQENRPGYRESLVADRGNILYRGSAGAGKGINKAGDRIRDYQARGGREIDEGRGKSGDLGCAGG
jgi:hypothetical protein